MKVLEVAKTVDFTKYAVRFEKNEEMITSLEKFGTDYNVGFAEFTAIGAIEKIELGVFENGEYVNFTENALCELLSMNGNLSLKDGKSFAHTHPMMSYLNTKGELSFFGGHLFSAIVGVTVEMFITVYNKSIHRRFEESVKLNVLDLDKSLECK